tara:strand:+ start:217 stop:441 length:225 start_codon:yes stop_codon:yes gene_type:complete
MHWSGYYCEKCKGLQDAIACFGDRVYQVVDSVLLRKDAGKQAIKIADEIKKEIAHKTYNLRCKKDKSKEEVTKL